MGPSVFILFCVAGFGCQLASSLMFFLLSCSDLGQRLIDEEIRLRGPDFDPDIVHIPEEDIKPTLDCYDVNMTTGQFQICEKSEKGLLVAIAQGINAAVYTCKRDFENRQWNCTDPFGNAFTAGAFSRHRIDLLVIPNRREPSGRFRKQLFS